MDLPGGGSAVLGELVHHRRRTWGVAAMTAATLLGAAACGWYPADGGASALTRSLATAPDVMETLMPFLGQVMDEGAVDLATKELVILRVSELNGCRYCLATHRPAALEAGVPVPHVDA